MSNIDEDALKRAFEKRRNAMSMPYGDLHARKNFDFHSDQDWRRALMDEMRDNVILSVQIKRARQEIIDLLSEVDCRIEHGAQSNGHLEYVRNRLLAIRSGAEDVLSGVTLISQPVSDPDRLVLKPESDDPA